MFGTSDCNHSQQSWTSSRILFKNIIKIYGFLPDRCKRSASHFWVCSVLVVYLHRFLLVAEQRLLGVVCWIRQFWIRHHSSSWVRWRCVRCAVSLIPDVASNSPYSSKLIAQSHRHAPTTWTLGHYSATSFCALWSLKKRCGPCES